MLANPSSLDLISVPGMVPANVTVKIPSGNNIQVTCIAAYGTGLNARSCFDALAQSPTGNVQESWGNNIPGRHVDVTLPIILFSGKYASGGRC